MGKIFAQSFLFFMVFYVMSIVLTLSCSNWFMVWIGLEINMMSFIALFYDRSSISVEMCLKYFFIQSVGSGMLLMMFYSESKMFEFILLGVLSYKIGGGPFYFWFPSVSDSMSWVGCYYLMTFQKILPLVMISMLMSKLVWIIIVTSLVIGAMGSMNQKSAKRLMAYSSIHHVGWILMGNFLEESMWMSYLIMYMMLISGIMWTLGKDKILDISMMQSMSTKWTFVLGMLSLGGMPPMLGFFVKWWMFYQLMLVDKSMMILMIMMSVLMFYVYLRISYSVLMGSTDMFSWILNSKNKKKTSMDLVYMMGLNLSPLTWMLMK